MSQSNDSSPFLFHQKGGAKMKCDDCQYLGMVFDHLKDCDGIKIWEDCTYPLPYHVVPRAVPAGIEHNCLVYKAKEMSKSLEEKFCPFCGEKAESMPWHGRDNPKYQQKIGCSNGKCPMFHIWIPVEQWNHRYNSI